MTQLAIETVQNELNRTMRLLNIGANKVAGSYDTDEAIIMRTARTLLEDLYVYVSNQNERIRK